LIEEIAVDISKHGLSGFPIRPLSDINQETVQRDIKNPEDDIQDIVDVFVEGVNTGVSHLRQPALLLRGLTENGLLKFALSFHRFRVTFRLDRERDPPTMLAVPYRAKDQPTPQAEFAHPDLAIVLTALAYYAGGLAERELRICFQRLCV
jgi:hypothetical protein